MGALPKLRSLHSLPSHCLTRARHAEFIQEYVVNHNVLSWNDVKFNLAFQSLPQCAYCCQRVYSFIQEIFKVGGGGSGAQLAQSLECVTLDFWVMSPSSTLGAEIT